MTTKTDWLEEWAVRAAQELTEFYDAACEAMSGDDALPSVRALLDEFDQGMAEEVSDETSAE